jgi:hypothetical protein
LRTCSEFLRVKHGDGQIRQEKNGKDQADHIHKFIHWGLPQFVASLDVKECQGKKRGGEEQHGQILHDRTPKSGLNLRSLIDIPRLCPLTSRVFMGSKLSGAKSGCAVQHKASLMKTSVAFVVFEYRKKFLNKT